MRVQLLLLPLLAFAIALSTGCGKDGCTDPSANNYDEDATRYDGSCTYDPIPAPAEPDTPNVVLKLQPLIGGSNLLLEELYQTSDGNTVRVETFKIYMSNIRLVKTDDSEVLVRELALFDFDPDVMTTQLALDVTPGDYKEVRFNLGLSETQNALDPTDFAQDHPLSNDQNMHWDWNSKFIFVKFDGRSDTTGTASNFDHNFAYHVGADELYTEVTGLMETLTLADDTEATVTINLEVEEFWSQGVQPIDLKVDNSTHTLNNMPLAQQFIGNVVAAFSN